MDEPKKKVVVERAPRHLQLGAVTDGGVSRQRKKELKRGAGDLLCLSRREVR